MIAPKISLLFLAIALCETVSANYGNDYDSQYHTEYRPNGYGDFQMRSDHQEAQPQNHHEEPKHHNYDHGTSSMSFYQKVKDHEHKFKFEQKHGKHGYFHGYAHPYAYGGLKASDW